MMALFTEQVTIGCPVHPDSDIMIDGAYLKCVECGEIICKITT